MTSQRSLSSLIILLALVILPTFYVECRPNYNQNRQIMEQMMPTDYLSLDQESLQDYLEKLNQITENDPNYLSNWPYLREVWRLKDLSQKDTLPYEIIPTPQPLQQIQVQPNRNSIKDSAQKKNSNSRRNPSRNEYMHACHFKICNMGRKRNVRYDY